MTVQVTCQVTWLQSHVTLQPGPGATQPDPLTTIHGQKQQLAPKRDGEDGGFVLR